MTKYWNKFSLTLKLVRPYSMKKKYHYEKVNREKNVFHRLYILFDKWRKNSSSYIIGHTKKLAVLWWFTWTAVKMWYTAKLRFLRFSMLRKKSIYCLNAIRNKVECFFNFFYFIILGWLGRSKYFLVLLMLFIYLALQNILVEKKHIPSNNLIARNWILTWIKSVW